MSAWKSGKKSILVYLISLIFSIVGAGRAWAGIWFSSPADGSTVSGTVTIIVNPDSGTSWSNWYLDGVYQGSTPPTSFSWNTSGASNGTHHLTATAFGSSGNTLGSAATTITVANGSSSGGGVSITSPRDGSTVSGTTSIDVLNAGSTSWSNIYIDGVYANSTPPTSFSWNTSGVSDGAHQISATALDSSHNNLGTSIVRVTVANGSSGSDSSTPSPTVRTTTLTLTSANNGQTFDNYRISTTTDSPCILANGASNITISNSQIGPCGTNAGSNSQGIHFIGGTGNKVYDSYIHLDYTMPCAGNNITLHTGIYFDGSTSSVAQGNVIAFSPGGIIADGSAGHGTAANATINGNFILNTTGADRIGCGAAGTLNFSALGHALMTITGADSALEENNYIYECAAPGIGFGVPCDTSITGGSQPAFYEFAEDIISIYGTSGNQVLNNYVVGGHSTSGSGVIPDNTAALGSNVLIQGDIFINNTNAGAICGGTNCTLNNVLAFQNTANSYYPLSLFMSTAPCPVTNSKAWNPVGSHGFITDGSCTPNTSTNNFTSSAFPTLGTSSTVAQIEAVLGQPPLIPPAPKNCVAKSPYTTQTSKSLCQ